MRKTIFFLAVYAMAMAMVEAAAVIYLRELYYPQGFSITSTTDLKVLPERILRLELWREASTIMMIATISLLALGNWKRRIAAFIWTFSIWDLGYYLFLYSFLKWPPSLATADVYFLIPRPWIGPVWIPLIIFSVLAVVSFRLLNRARI